jgi:hypothetical protein
MSSYSQNNPINGYISSYGDYEDIKGCVESIKINVQFENENPQYRWLNLYKIFYSQNQKRIVRLDYDKSFSEDPFQRIKYDSLDRVTLLKRKRNDTTTLVIKQFFNNESIYPDSTNFYNKVLKKTKQYINYFNDTTVIKQELYTNDILRTYKTFDYDTNNKLIKVIDINTKNGFGVTLGSSITGGKPKKYLNENDTIKYKHSMNGDTIVVSEYEKGKLQKVIKEIKSNDFSIRIVKNYFSSNFTLWNYHYSSRDSSFIRSMSINKDGKIKSSTNSIMYNSQTEYDEMNNWIKKTYIKNGKINRIVHRDIQYYRKD